MALKPNERLGEFVIVREIGRGGMGAVYEAIQTSLNRRVALKVLPPEMAGDTKAIRRFQREVEAVAKLNQPGIVPVYSVAEERGIHFYAMELVHGRPVSDLISETRHRLSSGTGVSDFMSAYTPGREEATKDGRHEMPTVIAPGESREALYKQIMFDEPERPRHLNRMLPADLETVILKAIEKDPTHRYQSAQELADDLRRYLNDEPVWAKPQRPVVRAAKWVKRNKALATVGTVAIVLIAATAIGLVTHHRLSAQRQATSLLHDAQAARERGQLKEAHKLCAKALGLWPGLGEAQREIGRTEELMVRAEDDRRVAEQKRKAQDKALKGLRLYQESRDLDRAIVEERGTVRQMRETIKGYDPPEKKAQLWQCEGQLEQMEQERAQFANEAEAHLLGALRLAPDNALAKQTLADMYWERLLAASATRQKAHAARYAELLRIYDEEGRYAARLKGDGTLEVQTTPPGASVTLYTYVEERPLLVARGERVLGESPVASFHLPMGSYLLIIKKEGFADTPCPVRIDRLEDESIHVNLYTPDEIGQGFVYVPAGQFLMGSANGQDPEDSIREVEVDDFFIAKHELTCREYREFVNDLGRQDAKRATKHLPRYLPTKGHYWALRDGKFIPDSKVIAPVEGPDYPIHSISLRDAQEYCAWRSRRDGVTYRVPTAVEWEKAARGVDGRTFPWGDHLDPALCNMRSAGKRNKVVPVGRFRHDCSPYGVLDMAGNMRELCAVPNAPGECVGKGGNFYGQASECRCSSERRMSLYTVYTQNSIRLVKVPPRRGDGD